MLLLELQNMFKRIVGADNQSKNGKIADTYFDVQFQL